MIVANGQDVLNHVFNEEGSVDMLLKEIRESVLDKELLAVSFLLDVCNSSKPLQTDAKLGFFNKLLDAGLVELLIKLMVLREEVLQDPHQVSVVPSGGSEPHSLFGVPKLELLKTNAGEILINCLQILPGN